MSEKRITKKDLEDALDEVIAERSRLRADNAMLVEALEFYVSRSRKDGEGINEHYERIADEFMRSTGMMAPGKSAPMEMEATRDREKEREKWDAFLAEPLVAAKAALAKVKK